MAGMQGLPLQIDNELSFLPRLNPPAVRVFNIFPEGKITAKNRLQQAWLFSHCRLIVSVCQAFQPGFNQGPSTGIVDHTALAQLTRCLFWPLLVTRFCANSSVPYASHTADSSAALDGCWFFQRTFVCFLLPPRGGENRGHSTSFLLALLKQLWMFIFCFSPVAHFPCEWIFAPRHEGWIWQSNRFHHFPDCAGTVMIRTRQLMHCAGAQPSTNAQPIKQQMK